MVRLDLPQYFGKLFSSKLEGPLFIVTFLVLVEVLFVTLYILFIQNLIVIKLEIFNLFLALFWGSPFKLDRRFGKLFALLLVILLLFVFMFLPYSFLLSRKNIIVFSLSPDEVQPFIVLILADYPPESSFKQAPYHTWVVSISNKRFQFFNFKKILRSQSQLSIDIVSVVNLPYQICIAIYSPLINKIINLFFKWRWSWSHPLIKILLIFLTWRCRIWFVFTFIPLKDRTLNNFQLHYRIRVCLQITYFHILLIGDCLLCIVPHKKCFRIWESGRWHSRLFYWTVDW